MSGKYITYIIREEGKSSAPRNGGRILRRNIGRCEASIANLQSHTSDGNRGRSISGNEVNHHHHVPEGLGVFPVPWSSRWSWSLHLFLGRPMFLLPFGLYCSACFGSLSVSILCTCCSHFFWYCFISFTVFCAPVSCPIHWFFSLSSFVIPSKRLKNFICAASKLCSSLFFSTQASLPNFNEVNIP